MGPYATPLRGLVSVRVFVFICLLNLNAFNLRAAAQQASTLPNVVQPRIVQAVDETQLTVLKGNTHRLARPQFDQGAAPADLPMDRMLLVLKRSPEQESALRKLLDDQQDKASTDYHKWLTPEQFGKQFGPADEDIQTVTSWLESHGFRIGNVAKGRNIIEFSGTATQVEEALHTSIHKYVVNGKEHWANASDPQIPAALTPVVAGVHTLHNFLKQPQLKLSEEKISALYVPGKQPLVTSPSGRHALGPSDYATIYNITPLYQSAPPIKGYGSVIAVVGRSDVYQNGLDIMTFYNLFQLGAADFYTLVNGTDPGDLGGGEEAEATLDATWSGAIAPAASVVLVVSASTNTTDGVDLSEEYIIENLSVPIMTESFGTCELNGNSTEAQDVENLAEQAAVQGITYVVSAGDSGAEGCDDPHTETVATHPVSVNVVASSRYTVAVGGTMFNEHGQDSKYWKASDGFIDESALSYIPENVWNESCLAPNCPTGFKPGIWAGGGGASIFFSKPTWQSGVSGIPNDGWRDLPDISLSAAGHDPYLICIEGSCVPNAQNQVSLYGVSGTSASAPSFAGIMALVDQKMNSPQGQADYVLYPLAAAEKGILSQCNASSTSTPPVSSCVFDDVTVGNNAVPGEVGYGKSTAQYQSTVGYDLATGLGSVNVANLVNKWNTVSFRPTLTTLSVSPSTITHGQALNITVTVAPQSGTGVPVGGIFLVTSNGQRLGAFPLTGGSFVGQIFSVAGGFQTLTANYSGDGTFGPSVSPPSDPITVLPEPSTATLSALGYPVKGIAPPFTGGPYGTFVEPHVVVKGQSGHGFPSGSVDVSDNGHNLPDGPYYLDSLGAIPFHGYFTFAIGTHSFIANYSGDPSFQPSPPTPPANFTITPAHTTTTVTAVGTTLTATVSTNSGGDGPSGTVTFSADGVILGNPVPVAGSSAQIEPQTFLLQYPAWATATVTAPKAPTKSFQAVYSADTNYLASTSSSVADFSVSPASITVTISSPNVSSGPLTLNVAEVDGVMGAVQFGACTGLPPESSCSFSPSSITGSGTATLTITTKAATASLLRPENRRGLNAWLATAGLALAGIVVLGVPAKRRRGGVLLSLVVCAALASAVSCGGGSSGGTSRTPPPDPGTPKGSYSVSFAATSGAVKHMVNIALTVQ